MPVGYISLKPRFNLQAQFSHAQTQEGCQHAMTCAGQKKTTAPALRHWTTEWVGGDTCALLTVLCKTALNQTAVSRGQESTVILSRAGGVSEDSQSGCEGRSGGRQGPGVQRAGGQKGSGPRLK